MKNSIKNLITKFKSSVSLLLLAILLFLALGEFYVLRNSLNFIFQAKFGDVGAKLSKSVRINFDTYNKIVARNKAAESYTPEILELPNPFTTFDTKKSK